MNLFKAYEIIMKAIEMPEFRKWLKELKENLEYDYDSYQTNKFDNFEEPLGFEIWALGRYLGELDG